MHPIAYFIMIFGAMLTIAGLILFMKRGTEGSNTIKMFGFEFQLAGSSLVVLVLGVIIFLSPIYYNEKFPKPSSQQGLKDEPAPSPVKRSPATRPEKKPKTPAKSSEVPAPEGTASIALPVKESATNVQKSSENIAVLHGMKVKIIYGRAGADTMESIDKLLDAAGAFVDKEIWLADQLPESSVIKYANHRKAQADSIQRLLQQNVGKFNLSILQHVGTYDIEVFIGHRGSKQGSP